MCIRDRCYTRQPISEQAALLNEPWPSLGRILVFLMKHVFFVRTMMTKAIYDVRAASNISTVLSGHVF